MSQTSSILLGTIRKFLMTVLSSSILLGDWEARMTGILGCPFSVIFRGYVVLCWKIEGILFMIRSWWFQKIQLWVWSGLYF